MILITGSNGFVGSYLYNHFSLDYKVVKTSRGKERDSVFLDVSQPKTFENLPAGIECIFHVAAYIPQSTSDINKEKCFEVNAEGTKNVLEYCRKKDIKIIYSSSSSVYQRFPNTTEEMVNPINVYGESKLQGEKYCQDYSKKYGIKYNILRYSTVYGNGQKPYSVLPLFVNSALKNENITVWGKGVRTQDFVYVKDVVQANELAFKKPKNEIYNTSSGIETNMTELASTVKNVLNPKIKINHKEVKDEDTSRFYLNISKAKKDLGYKPEYNLEEGLKDLKKEFYEAGNNC